MKKQHQRIQSLSRRTTMALSNVTPDKIDMAIDLAQSLKTLLDGNALASAVKQYYGLTEAEKATAEEARKNIAYYQAQIAEHQKKKDALDALEASLISDQKIHDDEVKNFALTMDKKNQEIADAWAAIDLAKKDLANRESIISDKKSSIDQQQKDIDIQRQQIEVDRANADKGNADLAARKKSFDDYQLALKANVAAVQVAASALAS